MNGVLVTVQSPDEISSLVDEYLDELSFLGETAGIKEKGRFIQKLSHPDGRTFVGKGKLAELKAFSKSEGIDCLLFDDDLTASQLWNIEKEFNKKDDEEKVRIYDRSLLILEIFQMRATTAQARVQVELAMNEYLLPRLTRLWTHLERQRGGTGTRGGAGEKEIETDRRQIRHRIGLLKQELKKIEKQRNTQRKGRTGMVRAALVGYTNVGKSTIMNLMSKSSVKAENKLFATVDSTVRKVVVEGIPFLLSDTVGFIRKLPHHLVESFKSTLDEVRESDLLLHVVDISHPFHENQIEVVRNTLNDIGAGGKPTLLILNKADRLPAREAKGIVSYWRGADGFDDVLLMSALEKEGKAHLREKIYKWVAKLHKDKYPGIRYPSDTYPVDQ